MQNYSDITDNLTKIARENKAFKNQYDSALSHLNEFRGTVSGLNDFSFSIQDGVIEVDFLDEKYFIEFQYSRSKSTPKGELSLYVKDALNKKVFITSQEFRTNGEVVGTSLSLSDDSEVLTVVLNLVKIAIEL